jgi:hypothetical protein
MRKRPCRICKRWFIPHPRVKERQKTCGDPKCQREWHRRKCEEWNRQNADYFKANYLAKKLDAENSPKSRIKTGLPIGYVQELIGSQQLIIIEYLSQLLMHRCRHWFDQQITVNGPTRGRLPPSVFLRGDTHLTFRNHPGY